MDINNLFIQNFVIGFPNGEGQIDVLVTRPLGINRLSVLSGNANLYLNEGSILFNTSADPSIQLKLGLSSPFGNLYLNVTCDDETTFVLERGQYTIPNVRNCQCNACFLPLCSNIPASNSSVCSGKGICITNTTCRGCPAMQVAQCCFNNGMCQCTHSYQVPNCEYPICYGLPANSLDACNGRGKCIAPNQCVQCGDYSGPQCEFPICFGKTSNDTSVCNGHGHCTSPNQCTNCDLDWTGSECEIPKCFGTSSNENGVCSQAGNCTTPNNCSCIPGYTGVLCELTLCFNVTSSSIDACSGVGRCDKPDSCSCQRVGYSGLNCECYLLMWGKDCRDSPKGVIIIFFCSFLCLLCIPIGFGFMDLIMLSHHVQFVPKYQWVMYRKLRDALGNNIELNARLLDNQHERNEDMRVQEVVEDIQEEKERNIK
jgi:hypothetical protein